MKLLLLLFLQAQNVRTTGAPLPNQISIFSSPTTVMGTGGLTWENGSNRGLTAYVDRLIADSNFLSAGQFITSISAPSGFASPLSAILDINGGSNAFLEAAGQTIQARIRGNANLGASGNIVGLRTITESKDTAIGQSLFSLYSTIAKSPTSNVTNAIHIWLDDLSALTTANKYAFWYDGKGDDCTGSAVYRINGLGIPALYNPCFEHYFAGHTRFERLVQQWENNRAVIRTEAGTTGGLLRDLELGGGNVLLSPSPGKDLVIPSLACPAGQKATLQIDSNGRVTRGACS